MTEIAKAYVQIVPSMQGFGDQVKSTITGATEKAGSSDLPGTAAENPLGISSRAQQE